MPYELPIPERRIDDIENLRLLAFEAAWKPPNWNTIHWDEARDGRIVFCFESRLAWFRFVRACAQLRVWHC